jgi:hypothetical protein
MQDKVNEPEDFVYISEIQSGEWSGREAKGMNCLRPSNLGIVGSKPTRSMYSYVCLF